MVPNRVEFEAEDARLGPHKEGVMVICGNNSL
jgi:hypothetical protein